MLCLFKQVSLSYAYTCCSRGPGTGTGTLPLFSKAIPRLRSGLVEPAAHRSIPRAGGRSPSPHGLQEISRAILGPPPCHNRRLSFPTKPNHSIQPANDNVCCSSWSQNAGSEARQRSLHYDWCISRVGSGRTVHTDGPLARVISRSPDSRTLKSEPRCSSQARLSLEQHRLTPTCSFISRRYQSWGMWKVSFPLATSIWDTGLREE